MPWRGPGLLLKYKPHGCGRFAFCQLELCLPGQAWQRIAIAAFLSATMLVGKQAYTYTSKEIACRHISQSKYSYFSRQKKTAIAGFCNNGGYYSLLRNC